MSRVGEDALSAEAPPVIQPDVKAVKATRTADILLERLLKEPAVKPQAPVSRLIGIFALIAALGIAAFLYTRKEDKFIEAQGNDQQHATLMADTSALHNKRVAAQTAIDSLQNHLRTNSGDTSAQLTLANRLYDAEYWRDAKREYEAYLKANPRNADARVDYAFSIAQADEDYEGAIAQMDKAIDSDPNHVQALFNAGILSLRTLGGADHAAGLKKAKAYFERARVAAQKSTPDMVPQIDNLIEEIENVGKKQASE
jgi:tetratricopeptide (TPR) repeat protein